LKGKGGQQASFKNTDLKKLCRYWIVGFLCKKLLDSCVNMTGAEIPGPRKVCLLIRPGGRGCLCSYHPPPTTAKCTEDGTSLRKASRTSDHRLVFNVIDALGYSDYGALFTIC
jgi:hypothetical protein